MPQTIFPITTVGLGQAAGLVDLSPYLPSDATGAILLVYNNSAGVRAYMIRMNGSADNRVGDMSGSCQCWAMIGCDANQRIFISNPSAFPSKIGFGLVGYTKAGVTFNTNAPLISGGVGAVWTMQDLSALIPSNAIGVIIEIFGIAGNALGVRQNGSGDNRVSVTSNEHNTFSCIVGCDALQRIEIYGGGWFFLTGYITEGATFYLNAVDITPVGVGAYEVLPPLPQYSVMGFVEVNSTGRYALLKNGGVAPGYRNAGLHPWAVVECDENWLMQGIRELIGGSFFLTGYGTYMPPTVQTDPATEIT